MGSSTPCAAARPNACCGTWRVRCSRCRRFRPIHPNRAARCQSVEGAPRLSRARRIAGRGRGQFDALPPLRVANSLAADGQTLLAGAVPGSIWLLAGSTTGPRNYPRSHALLLKFFHCGECPRRCRRGELRSVRFRVGGGGWAPNGLHRRHAKLDGGARHRDGRFRARMGAARNHESADHHLCAGRGAAGHVHV